MVKAVINFAKHYVVIISLAMVTLTVTGQGNTQKLSKIIVVSDNKIRVDSLLNIFTKQTQIDFSFNSKKINPGKVIPVVNKRQTLAKWLYALQHDMGIHYTLLGDHIILVDKPTPVNQKLVMKKRSVNYHLKSTASNIAVSSLHSTNDKNIFLSKDNRDTTSENLNSNRKTGADEKPVRDTIIFNSDLNDSLVIDNNRTRKPDSSAGSMEKKNIVETPVKQIQKRKNTKELDKNLIVEIGLNISKPGSFSKGETSSSYGIGPEVKLEKSFSKKISGTLGIGYNYFIGSYTHYNFVGSTRGNVVDTNFANLPILAGIKYYFGSELYLSGEAGMVVKASSNTGSHLAISSSAGYILRVAGISLGVGIKLTYVTSGLGTLESTSLQNGGYSFWSLRIAYSF